VFHNEEDVGAYGIVTAEAKTLTTTYTNTSARTYFPPHEDITVTIINEGAPYDQHLSCNIYVSDVESVSCPDYNGTGVVSITSICPECNGTGFVASLPGEATNFLVVGGAAVGVVAALAVSAVLVVKRKRVTEERLRRLAPSEFQEWAIQRLVGRASSQRDFYMGIDGYTGEGYPIQVKQSDDIGRNVIDSFAASMGRSKTKNGIIVAFSFGRGALEGVVRAKLNYGLEIKTVTVKELMESSNRAY
jgi:hypothetical protein